MGSFAPQGFSPSQTLIEHWNGTTWSVVASPNVGTQLNGLNGVTAVSTSDIWAVGSDGNTGGAYHPAADPAGTEPHGICWGRT